MKETLGPSAPGAKVSRMPRVGREHKTTTAKVARLLRAWTFVRGTGTRTTDRRHCSMVRPAAIALDSETQSSEPTHRDPACEPHT